MIYLIMAFMVLMVLCGVVGEIVYPAVLQKRLEKKNKGEKK